MKKYEINFVLNKKLTHYGRLNISKKIIQSILQTGGLVTNVYYLGLHSYFSSKKLLLLNSKGKFSIIKCYLNPKSINDIKILLNQNEYIINHLILKSK